MGERQEMEEERDEQTHREEVERQTCRKVERHIRRWRDTEKRQKNTMRDTQGNEDIEKRETEEWEGRGPERTTEQSETG